MSAKNPQEAAMKSNSSKTGLFLMELIIAVLFFSLAGAVCVRLFVQSYQISNQSVLLNHSVLWAQNTAEVFYGCDGDVEQMAALLGGGCIYGENEDGRQWLILSFDDEFNPIGGSELIKNFAPFPVAYILQASITEKDGLTVCDITVKDGEDTGIYSLSVSLFPDKEAEHE